MTSVEQKQRNVTKTTNKLKNTKKNNERTNKTIKYSQFAAIGIEIAKQSLSLCVAPFFGCH